LFFSNDKEARVMGMKRWIKSIGVTITSLLILASQASVVLARAGGGKSGSLGGSSGGSFSGGSFSGGGLSGGSFSGGFPSRGFGGFFPFFWFGGSSTGGSLFGGLFNLIIIFGIVYLIIKVFRSSQQRRAGGKGFENPFQKKSKGDYRNDMGGAYSSQTPVDVTGKPITNDYNVIRFSKAINFTKENMRYYAETFPRWDRDYLVGRVRAVYYWLQDSWTRQDLSGAEEYVTPALREKYRRDLAQMKARGERNVIKEPVLHAEDIEFIHSHLDELEQRFIVMISASLIDYTVDASGRIIAGEDDNRLYFTEFWEFRWVDNQWMLSEILQEDALEITKIARGDEY
jgi:predicted lipid-binding transport protein (Tim44 family)